MADTNLASLLQQIGLKTDTEIATEEQARQIQQIQMQLQQQQNNLGVGKMSEGFGFPAYQAAQMRSGNPGQSPIQIPGVNPPQGAMRTPGIMPGPTSTPSPAAPQNQPAPTKKSEQLIQLMQQFQSQGKAPEAHRLRLAAMQAQVEEQEQERQQQELLLKQLADLRARTGMGAVHTSGTGADPYGRQGITQATDPTTGAGLWNPDGSPNMVKVGDPYKVSEGNSTHIDMGGMLDGDKEQTAARDFGTVTENTLNFLHAGIPAYKLLGEGASSGITASLMTKVDNAMATARTSLELLVDPNTGSNVQRMVNDTFADKGKWKRVAGKTQLSQAAMVGLAYTLAASYNKDGRISDKDMEKALTELGGNLSDPESARRVLRQAINRTKGRYQTSFRVTSPMVGDKLRPKIKTMFDDAIGDFDRFDSEYPTEAPSAEQWDAEKEARYQEYLRNRNKK